LAIGAHGLDEVELAQSSQGAGDTGIGPVWQKRFEVGTTESPEVEFGTLQRPQQGIVGTVEEVEALEGMAIDVLRARQSQARRRAARASGWLCRGRRKSPPVPRLPVKKYAGTGRNETCPCGSGKKYKVCCGR